MKLKRIKTINKRIILKISNGLVGGQDIVLLYF
jgi:hypothetical protein